MHNPGASVFGNICDKLRFPSTWTKLESEFWHDFIAIGTPTTTRARLITSAISALRLRLQHMTGLALQSSLCLDVASEAIENSLPSSSLLLDGMGLLAIECHLYLDAI